MRERKWLCICIGLLFLFGGQIIIAQTTGKVAGIVFDEATGQPLPGANVFIEGTTFGAAADMQGEFYMINIPPGSFTIVAQMMGYSQTRVEEVRVATNRTITLEFKLKTTVIEGEVVTVKADKVALKKDQTSSIRNISSDDIEVLPAESIGQVVAMQPGVVGGHFRGGRSNEVTYLIDGMSVTDAYSHESRTTNVNPEVVEDVEVITGTFNAEYGNAMSGVVNIVTKEGRNNVTGSASINFGNYLTPHTDIFLWHENENVSRIQDFKGAISGPIFDNKLFYVANLRFNSSDGYLNGLRLFQTHDYSNYTDQDAAFWHLEASGDSAVVPMNVSENISAFGKLTYRVMPSMKISLSGSWNKGDGKGYSHSERYNPDGVPGWHNNTKLGILHINHMLSKSAFYDFKVSYSDHWNGWYLFEDPTDPRYVHDEYRRSNGTWFLTGGQGKGHTTRTEKKVNAKFDFIWQVNKRHSIKTGLDFSRNTLNHISYGIRNGFEGTGLEAVFYDNEEGKRVYPFYEPIIHENESTHTDMFEVNPIEAAVYIQDKMEWDMMVVNLGVRFDYFDPQTVYPSNWRNPANQQYFEETERMSTYLDADPKYQISPRLGLSYDLGGSALLRFAYGHFLQLPPLTYYYQNSTFIVAAQHYASRMGNAQLEPQKTVQYEVGLFQQLTQSMSVEVAVWYKDIYDLVSATVYTTYNQRRFGVYTNKEYGNARGLEVKYDFRTGPISAGLNYTFGYTRGVADNPNSTFSRAGSKMDPVNKLIPLNWDQRHTLNVYAGYNKREYGVTMMCYLNSGYPYTWSPISQNRLSAVNLFPNNQVRPTRVSVDLNAHTKIANIGGTQIRATLLVYNLFDRLNESWVNGQTGRAYTAIVQETDLMGYRSTFSEFADTYQNPSMYSAPRMVKVGLGFNF